MIYSIGSRGVGNRAKGITIPGQVQSAKRLQFILCLNIELLYFAISKINGVGDLMVEEGRGRLWGKEYMSNNISKNRF